MIRPSPLLFLPLLALLPNCDGQVATVQAKSEVQPKQSSKVESSPCKIRGWSVDQDPNGLNVRSAPDIKADIRGKLYSVEIFGGFESKDGGKAEELVGPYFNISGVSGDWVKIAGADPISEGSNVEKENYTGEGWVHASRVRAAMPGVDIYSVYNNGFSGPDEGSAIVDPSGTTNYASAGRETPVKPKLLDCSGEWAKVRYQQSGKLGPNRQWVDFSSAEIAKRPAVEAWFRSGFQDPARDEQPAP